MPSTNPPSLLGPDHDAGNEASPQQPRRQLLSSQISDSVLHGVGIALQVTAVGLFLFTQAMQSSTGVVYQILAYTATLACFFLGAFLYPHRVAKAASILISAIFVLAILEGFALTPLAGDGPQFLAAAAFPAIVVWLLTALLLVRSRRHASPAGAIKEDNTASVRDDRA